MWMVIMNRLARIFAGSRSVARRPGRSHAKKEPRNEIALQNDRKPALM